MEEVEALATGDGRDRRLAAGPSACRPATDRVRRRRGRARHRDTRGRDHGPRPPLFEESANGQAREEFSRRKASPRNCCSSSPIATPGTEIGESLQEDDKQPTQEEIDELLLLLHVLVATEQRPMMSSLASRPASSPPSPPSCRPYRRGAPGRPWLLCSRTYGPAAARAALTTAALDVPTAPVERIRFSTSSWSVTTRRRPSRP